MTSDLDIYSTASALIRERGDETDLVAAQRTDSFLEDGDVDGCSVWKRGAGGNGGNPTGRAAAG